MGSINSQKSLSQDVVGLVGWVRLVEVGYISQTVVSPTPRLQLNTLYFESLKFL